MSGITPEVWAEMGEKTIITALDILKGNQQEQAPADTSSGQEAPAGWELQSV